MPEGDTVFLAATRLRRALEGRELTRTDFRIPTLATTDLGGRTVDEVVARGKHLLFRLSGGATIHSHFRMQGSWHVYRPRERWRGPAFEVRAVLTTEAWLAVGFRLPVLEVIPTASESDVVGHLGPDLLGPDWDAAEALRRLAAEPERAIGEALLDQRVMAGLGNIYKCEVCFLRGLHPWTPVGRVVDLSAAVVLSKRLITANKTTGSQITTGDARHGRQRWVYGRGGEPCRRCRAPIMRAQQGEGTGERVTYWCPRCQPEI